MTTRLIACCGADYRVVALHEQFSSRQLAAGLTKR